MLDYLRSSVYFNRHNSSSNCLRIKFQDNLITFSRPAFYCIYLVSYLTYLLVRHFQIIQLVMHRETHTQKKTRISSRPTTYIKSNFHIPQECLRHPLELTNKDQSDTSTSISYGLHIAYFSLYFCIIGSSSSSAVYYDARKQSFPPQC